MPRWRSGFAAGPVALLAAGLAACAQQQQQQQQQSRPAAMSGQGTGGAQGVQGQAASGGMQGHAGHGMAVMDHRSMMNHCAEMRQTVRQGGRLSPDMQRMMGQCDQMDFSMGASRPR